MRVSLAWLNEWVETGWDAATAAARLTMGGIEVESIEPAAPAFTGVVVGEVLSVARHPDADKLTVCQVESGNGRLQIVCGASNVRAGMKTPLALEGATLPDDVPPAVQDVQAYIEGGNYGPALEFVSPLKGPSLEQITVEVAFSG